jgi:lysophospholipase L1-like esterase
MTTTHATALVPELRYLALGDSYTIGEDIDEAGRWPMQLSKALRAEGIPIADPRIIAKTGWTTDELDAAITAQEPVGEYDFVSLLIGVNNQYRGRSVEEYRVQFAALLWRAIGFARNRPERVLVLSIPDWGVTPFAQRQGRDTDQIARELDAYNLAAREACQHRSVAFVDIAKVSREYGSEAKMLAGDGLHPSAAMYAEWTKLAFPVAHRLLAA